ALSGDRLLLREARAMRVIEESIWRTADVIWYPSQEEVEHVHARFPEVDARVIPAYAFDDDADASPSTSLQGRHDVLFVAGFGHPANIDAARWLVSEILPRLARLVPGVTVTLAGSRPTAEVRALASAQVTLEADVSMQRLDA